MHPLRPSRSPLQKRTKESERDKSAYIHPHISCAPSLRRRKRAARALAIYLQHHTCPARHSMLQRKGRGEWGRRIQAAAAHPLTHKSNAETAHISTSSPIPRSALLAPKTRKKGAGTAHTSTPRHPLDSETNKTARPCATTHARMPRIHSPRREPRVPHATRGRRLAQEIKIKRERNNSQKAKNTHSTGLLLLPPTAVFAAPPSQNSPALDPAREIPVLPHPTCICAILCRRLGL